MQKALKAKDEEFESFHPTTATTAFEERWINYSLLVRAPICMEADFRQSFERLTCKHRFSTTITSQDPFVRNHSYRNANDFWKSIQAYEWQCKHHNTKMNRFAQINWLIAQCCTPQVHQLGSPVPRQNKGEVTGYSWAKLATQCYRERFHSHQHMLWPSFFLPFNSQNWQKITYFIFSELAFRWFSELTDSQVAMGSRGGTWDGKKRGLPFWHQEENRLALANVQLHHKTQSPPIKARYGKLKHLIPAEITRSSYLLSCIYCDDAQI